MSRWWSILAVVAVLLTAVPASATQNDPRLPELFDRLRTTDDPREAQILELAIWQIWTEAGEAATDSLMRLGLQAMQTGNLPGALELFDAVTTRKPDFAEGWNKRATVLFLMGAYEASAKDVDKTLALEPRHFGALAGLGLINMALDRQGDAAQAFERALKIHPHLAGAKANLETLRKKRREKAI